MSEKLTLEQRALAAAVELLKATQQRTELRQERRKLMDDCERCPEDESLCVYRPTEEWCESCAEHAEWPERYKVAATRRTKALQRLRYIGRQAMKGERQ